MKTIKERAEECISEYAQKGAAATAHLMAALLQQLIDAPEAEPFAVIHLDGSFVHVEFKQPIAGTGKFEVYTAPPAPSVPVDPMENIALNEWFDKTEWVQKEINTFPVSSLGMHRADVMRLEIERLRKLLSAAPTPAEAPADAERLNWLDVQCSENNGRHIFCLPGGLRAAIDAAMSKKGGA